MLPVLLENSSYIVGVAIDENVQRDIVRIWSELGLGYDVLGCVVCTGLSLFSSTCL